MKPTQLLALCGLFASPAALVAQNEPPRPDQPPSPGRPAPPEVRRDPLPPSGREPGRPDAGPRREGLPPEGRREGPAPEARRDAPPPERPRGDVREPSREGQPSGREPGSRRPEAPPPGREARRDAPRDRAPGPEAERRDDRPQHGHEDKARSRGHAGEMRQVSYLGVLTGPVSPEARAHLGLKEGFGLRVAEVQRGSPAQVAGLKENDVLVRFEDQRLASMEQLQALVRERSKGERVNLLVISAGKESVVAVEVGETSVPVHPESHGPRFMPPLPEARFGELREHWERHRRSLQEWQERMRHGGRESGRGEAPPPVHGGPSGERGTPEARRGESRGVSTVTRSDDSGIYTLKREGDRVTFSAQPREGEARSWKLPEEHDRIPEPLRDKLRQLEEIRGDRDEGRNRPPADGRIPENGPRGRN